MQYNTFDVPILIDDEICQFFSVCDMGSAISGQFIINQRGSRVPDLATLEQSDIPLSDCLYFTNWENNNPLYGIIYQATLTSLFSIHAYYSNMQIPNGNRRLSASADMRKYLKQTLIKAIKYSAQKIISLNINDVKIIDQVLNMVELLIQSIDDPSLAQGQIMIAGHEMFNPNFFLYAHFSTLINVSKIKVLSSNELDLLQIPTKDAYQDIIPFNYTTPFGEAFAQLEDDKYLILVLNYQKDITSLARDYKNVQQKIRQRERRALDNI